MSKAIHIMPSTLTRDPYAICGFDCSQSYEKWVEGKLPKMIRYDQTPDYVKNGDLCARCGQIYLTSQPEPENTRNRKRISTP